MRNGPLSAALLAFAAAAFAAPPLSIPIPRPTPEQEERMRIEAEQAEYLESLEAAADAASAAETADADTAAVPEVPEGPPPPPPPPPDASLPPPPPPPDAAPADETPAPGPATETEPPSAAEAKTAEGGTPGPGPAAAPPADPPAVFRRDPFWTADVARARKADHDAALAAKAEAEKRQAAIDKARAEAAAKGLDVENLDEEDLEDLAAGGSGLPRPDKAKGKDSSFGGATDAEWEAAFAKIPPRSGYLGGKKPALMLKGIKKPFFEGDELCVTNRGVVFSWRVVKVDFRAYAHELDRVKAFPQQKSE